MGTATVTITGIGNYEGIIEKTFKITPASIESLEVSGIEESYVYTGNKIKPFVDLEGFEEMTLGEDYEVSYADNLNVGTAEVTITGKGNYEGAIVKTFEITPADITGVEVAGYEGVYDGESHTISFNGIPEGATVTYASEKEGEYIAESPSLKNVGELKVYYKINFANHKELAGSEIIKITPASIERMPVKGIDESYVYTGNRIKPEVTLEGFEEMTLGEDYEVSYADNLNVGTATVTITGIGNYEGQIIMAYSILPIDISDLSYSGIDDTYSCTAEAIEPIVEFESLKEGQDYKVSYKNNINAGVATVTITGINNYTGVITKDFNIEHSFSNDWKTDNQKHWHECVCGTKSDEINHSEVIDEAISPSCTETGITEGKHCSICNEVLIAQETIAALGHKEVIDEAVAATCETTGLTEGRYCSVCDEVFAVQTVIPAKGHTEVVDKAVSATCTETGLTEGKHCSVCDTVLIAQETVSALGHDMGDWIVTKAATYTEKGHKYRECSRCDLIENADIDKLPIKDGTWKKSGKKWWYKCEDGTYPANGWATINGKDYYFDKSGYMAVSKWIGDYYVDASGAKQKNKAVGTYYVGADGKYVKNQWVGSKYYGKSGAYTKGWLKLDEGWYYFNTSGVVKKGWFQVGKTWYYGDKSTGLLYEAEWLDNTYYFKSGGAMATGWLKLDEGWYYFASSGAVKRDWFKVGKTWYYGDPETGILYEGKWLDDIYYFKSGGAMATGWLELDGEWYYFQSSGAAAEGWLKISKKWYYFDDDKKMVTGDYMIDGVVNEFADSGVWLGTK